MKPLAPKIIIDFLFLSIFINLNIHLNYQFNYYKDECCISTIISLPKPAPSRCKKISLKAFAFFIESLNNIDLGSNPIFEAKTNIW